MLGDQADACDGAERARLLGEAEKAYRQALEVRTRAALPEAWAMTQYNLAIALGKESMTTTGVDRVRLLGESVEAFRGSIEVLGSSELRRTQLAGFLGAYANALLFARQPLEAARAAEEALTLTPGQLRLIALQAHGYLVGGEVAKAEAIYRKYAKNKQEDGTRFADIVLGNFYELRHEGIDPPDTVKIEQIMVDSWRPVGSAVP
jgi:tetratricopeptide (TPR) repeat protein